MKRYAIAMVLLAVAGVLFAQEAPDAEKLQAPTAESAAEVKEAPAAAPAAEGDFCCRERMQDGKPTLGKCHRKACKFFPRKDVKCFPTAEAAKAAGCAGFCKICCKDLQ